MDDADADEKALGQLLGVWAKKAGVEAAASYWKDQLAGPPYFITKMSALESMAQDTYWGGFLEKVAVDHSVLAVNLREWGPKSKDQCETVSYFLIFFPIYQKKTHTNSRLMRLN
jgi:hypothetical protein